MAEFLSNRIPLLLLLLLGTAFTFAWTMLNRDRLRYKWYVAAPLALLHTVVGTASVMAFAQLENLGRSTAPGQMSLFGAIFFLPLFYFLLAKISKRKTADVFDVFTVNMAFTLLCARINCILSGCCLGKCITGADGPRWPTREIEIGFYIVILTFLILRTLKQKNHGELYPLYMICYGVFRFIIEFFRESTSSDSVLHISHLWALLSVGIGLSIYFEIQRKQSKDHGGNKK
ncbi:MAG: prolipoprotein diacylglyceryl transferase [Oscillospiraceae bacterium]|nr:prolipoprotein diacylglyceryl transferase [Oscillospiraceae bacterium]